MIVYGIDFSSSPSSLRSQAKSRKWMYEACCNLDGNRLVVESLNPLNGEKNDDYTRLSERLKCPGPWIAGIDVPFGMPIECVEHFRWITSDDKEQNWETYVERVRAIQNRKEFKRKIENWRHPTRVNASGDKERVRKYRIIDKLIGSQSPMNCIRPAVGSMFFEACELLRSTSASIPPVRCDANENRTVIETYPRLVVNRLIGSDEYKDADDLEDVRRQIVDGLGDSEPGSLMRQWYGISVVMEETVAEECIEDSDGDKIDSVMCAVQAAWAFRQERHGIPHFATSVMNRIVAMEGWVPDPFVANWEVTA